MAYATIVSLFNSYVGGSVTSPISGTAASGLHLYGEPGSGTCSIDIYGPSHGSAPNTIAFNTAAVQRGQITATGLFSWAGAATVTGKLIAGGTTSNDSAASGVIGESLSQSRLRSAATGATTGTSLNVLATPLTLTAGDWDISGALGITANAATTVSIIQAAISVTSATLSANDTIAVPSSSGEYRIIHSQPAAIDQDESLSFPTFRISISSSTTFYLVANVTFAVNTLSVFGFLMARRAR